MDGQARIRRAEQVVARELAEGEGGVLLHLDSADYFSVNPVGMAIWDALDRERTADELVEHVRSRVDGAPPELEADVLAFLDAARDRGVIVVDA